MREPLWKETNYTQIQVVAKNDVGFQEKRTKAEKKLLLRRYVLNNTHTIFLYVIFLLATVSAIYTLWNIRYNGPETSMYFSDANIERLINTIVNSTDQINNLTTDDDGKSNYAVEVLFIDEQNRVILWSQNLSLENLKDLKKIERRAKISNIDNKEYSWNVTPDDPPPARQVRSVTAQAMSRGKKKYVVSYQTRFVSCSRFKPIHRGRYLVTPSLASLHTCYEHGVTLNEMEKGVVSNKAGQLRYNLDHLYVTCEIAFSDNLDELTDELRDDYERCKWSGGLSQQQQMKVEERFAAQLATSDQNDVPLNLTDPKPASNDTEHTSPNTPPNPQAFVECSHVETELVDDYFESPSYDALHRCEKFGVTIDELQRGIAVNPQPQLNRASEVSSLYIPCMDVFGGDVNYMTSELRDDYRRCKSTGAISQEVQLRLEKRFYEALDGEKGESGTTEKTTEKPATSSTAASAYQTTSTTTTTTTSKRPNASRYAFANCKRIENRAYLICIKIIKVYTAPIQFRLAEK